MLRGGSPGQGGPEGPAERSGGLGLMAMLFAGEYPGVDHYRVLKMCVVHDLGEALHGDIPAIYQDPTVNKAVEERKHLLVLLAPLPADMQAELLALWDEYNAAATPEARLAKAFDKLETVLQHTQGLNPPDFDYAFNLGYARQYTDYDALTRAVRALIDAETARLAGL